MQTRLSLVICTYNRADILPRCLNAACRQTMAASGYEIIVVDNASTDHTGQLVRQIAAQAAVPVKYVYHPEKGVSHARNAGAKAALAPIVTYIDDDAIAAPDMVWQIVRTFEEYPRAGCVGGRIDICLPDRLPGWYSSFFDGYYSQFDLGAKNTFRVSELWQYPFGANISFRAEALQQIGYFNTALGRMGKDFAGGEEIDAAIRLSRAGFEIFYNPAVAVKHIILPTRIRWQHIAKSAVAAGRNWAYYEMELLEGKRTLTPDVLALLATIKEMATGVWKSPVTAVPIAYSKHLFIRSKLKRKLQYRLRGIEQRQPA